MLDKIIPELLVDSHDPENAVGMISSLIFHRLLKQANVVVHDIDLEESDHYYGTFLLEKPKEPKTICKISLESAVKEIIYEDVTTKKIWEGYKDPQKLEARVIEILKPRVRLAEILSAAGSLDEAQAQVELEFGALGKKMLIIRKGA